MIGNSTGYYLDMTGEGDLMTRGHELTVRDANFEIVFQDSFGSYASAANFFHEHYGKGYTFTVE